MKNILAVIGAVIAILAALPYLIDIVKKKTKPNIVSWSIWTLLTAIATAAAFAAHEPRTALLTLGVTIGTGAVVLLGLKYGVAKMSLFDGLCLAGAVVGLGLWLVLDSPTAAIICTMAIDFTVMLPTLRHSWRKPQEETWQTFIYSGTSSIFTLASLSNFNFVSLAFPVYFLAADILVAGVIIYRRKQKKLTLAR